MIESILENSSTAPTALVGSNQIEILQNSRQFKPDNYLERGGFIELVHSFSFGHLYNFLSGSRAKPWDDRELDVLEGFKFISFVLCSISQTAFYLFYTTLIDLLSIFTLLRRIEVTQFIASNLGLETFIFVSVFLGAYRSF